MLIENSGLTPARKHTLAQVVTEQLRNAIIQGHFAPGQLLSEDQLARTLKVSRGPIRDALLHLEQEGLVSSQTNGRTVVARLSRRDLEEVYSLRYALERLAVQYAVHYAQPEDFVAMEDIINSLQQAAERGITEHEAAALDIGFHDLLYRSARHQRLLDAWSNIRSQVYVFLLSRNLANPDFREKVIIHGHTDILNAIREHDEKRAVESIEEHLRAAYTRIVKNYSAQESGDASLAPMPLSELTSPPPTSPVEKPPSRKLTSIPWGSHPTTVRR